MERVRVLRLLIGALILGSVATPAWTQATPQRPHQSTDTFLALSHINRAGPPRIIDDLVVFTYEQPRHARYVAVAFAHEQYRELHVLQARARTEQSDLFYLTYHFPRGLERLEYRLVVDGVWMVDPHAPSVRRDAAGVAIGVVALPRAEPHEWQSPLPNADGTVTFYFAFDLRVAATLRTVTGDYLSARAFDRPEITLVGSFNGWDPFVHRLNPMNEFPGVYSVRVPVPEGRHYYYFLVDGLRLLDPYNLSRARDAANGYSVSTFVMD